MAWKFTAQIAFMSAFIAVLLFWSAGTLDWPGAWIFLGEMAAFGLLICLWLLRHDPVLLRERLHGGFQKGQMFWDKVFMVILQVSWFGWLVLIAFDAKRWGLSHMPDALIDTGAVLVPVSFFIIWLTFRVNSFAAPVVKI